MFNLVTNVVFYGLVGLELFINFPINGVYGRLLKFSKDTIIVGGLILTALFASLMSIYVPLPSIITTLGILFYIIYTRQNLGFKIGGK